FNLIEMVSEYDVELAERLMNRLPKNSPAGNQNDLALSAVLRAKISRGEAIEKLEDELTNFTEWDYLESKPKEEYFLRRTQIYLTISDNQLYTDEERLESFNKALVLYKEMLKSDTNS